jgi:hypothetical protein
MNRAQDVKCLGFINAAQFLISQGLCQGLQLFARHQDEPEEKVFRVVVNEKAGRKKNLEGSGRI